MKSIPLGNSHELHVYLIKHEQRSLNEQFNESDSRQEDLMKDSIRSEKAQAKALLDCLEDHWNVVLLTEIYLEAARKIVDQWERFAPQRLEEPLYKQMKEVIESNKI